MARQLFAQLRATIRARYFIVMRVLAFMGPYCRGDAHTTTSPRSNVGSLRKDSSSSELERHPITPRPPTGPGDSEFLRMDRPRPHRASRMVAPRRASCSPLPSLGRCPLCRTSDVMDAMPATRPSMGRSGVNLDDWNKQDAGDPVRFPWDDR